MGAPGADTQSPLDVLWAAAKTCQNELSMWDNMVEAGKQTRKSKVKFIDKIVSMGHLSILEHIDFHFSIDGISRSAGVAGALAKCINGYDFEIFNKYIPNRRVYRLVMNAWYIV